MSEALTVLHSVRQGGRGRGLWLVMLECLLHTGGAHSVIGEDIRRRGGGGGELGVEEGWGLRGQAHHNLGYDV